jgi:hypothetical protein
MLTEPLFVRDMATAVYFGGKMDYEFYRNFNQMFNILARGLYQVCHCINV